MTSAFAYQNGILHVENVALEKIAAEVGTPFYVYSTAQLKKNFAEFATPFAKYNSNIYYAVKANPNWAVIRTLKDCGAGADITSIGELERALNAGVRPDKIAFSGVAKRKDEIIAALLAGIHQFNVESIPELHLINQTAGELARKAPITLRVNPDVSARTYKKTSTGELGTKFGIDAAQLEEAMKTVASLPNLELKGLTVHIGSHVHDYESFRLGYAKLAEIVRHWRGKGANIERLDLGGGVGIPYDGDTLPPFKDYAAIVEETVGDLGCSLSFEPGRRLVGDAGLLVSRAVYIKQGAAKRFVIIDAGMNDLIRPAMYGARHSALPVRQSDQNTPLSDLVGPICETSDIFGEDFALPGVAQGDLVAILQAGAYGAAMSSNYNGRALVPEVLVSGDQYSIVRRRIAVAEQIAWESLPSWLPAKGL
jgi:diaminopimelate decarboxylase